MKINPLPLLAFFLSALTLSVCGFQIQRLHDEIAELHKMQSLQGQCILIMDEEIQDIIKAHQKPPSTGIQWGTMNLNGTEEITPDGSKILRID